MAALLLLLALATISTARLTRLLTLDKITEPIRQWVVRKNGTDGRWSYLIHCPWCSSIWIAPAPALLVWYLTDAPTLLGITSWVGAPLTWLTTAYLAALIIQKED